MDAPQIEIKQENIKRFETEFEATEYSKLHPGTMVIKEQRYSGYYVYPKFNGVVQINSIYED